MITDQEFKDIQEIIQRLNIIWGYQDPDLMWLFFYSAPWQYELALVVEAIAHWLIQNEHLPRKTAWLFDLAKRCPEGEKTVDLARQLAVQIKQGIVL